MSKTIVKRQPSSHSVVLTTRPPRDEQASDIVLIGSIDRGSHVPAYVQLKDIFRATMFETHVPPGSRLPSVTELCAQFGVSRLTVTKALDDLVHEGLIIRVQGRGNFAVGRMIEVFQYGLLGFTRSMECQGLNTRSQVLSIDVIPGTDSITSAFKRAPHAPERYMRIRRRRLVDDLPSVITTSIVPESIGTQMQAYDLEEVSFHKLFAQLTGKHIVSEHLELKLVRVNREQSQLLEVGEGSAHFFVEGFCYLEGDLLIENSHNIFHGDRFSFAIDHRRQSETTGGG